MNKIYPERPGFPRMLDASVLKYIAVVTMLIDHAALCLIYNMILKPAAPISRGTQLYSLYLLYKFLRGVGRLAFPIFCFFLVEGFRYTRSRKKYALRLFLFGLISEVPFDLCSKLTFPNHMHQNVMFELLMGVIMLSAWEYFEHRKSQDIAEPDAERESETDAPKSSPAPSLFQNVQILTLLQVLSAAACMAAAQFLHLDYGYKGLGLILVLYLLQYDRLIQCAAGAVVIGIWELPAVLSFLLLFFYSGKRGKQSRYFFYAFYPVHLLLLYGISRLMP